MAYVDLEYYKNTYKGSIIPEEELEHRLDLASDNIDSLTYNRITGKGFDSLTTFQQDKIKKAVCCQADFMYQYGEYLNFPLSGYTAGSIQLNFNSDNSNGGNIKTSEDVMRYLNQTGLAGRIL